MTFSPIARDVMEKQAHVSLRRALERQLKATQDVQATEKRIQIVYEDAREYLEALAAVIHKEKIKKMMI